jgi:hypothetical protein
MSSKEFVEKWNSSYLMTKMETGTSIGLMSVSSLKRYLNFDLISALTVTQECRLLLARTI